MYNYFTISFLGKNVVVFYETNVFIALSPILDFLSQKIDDPRIHPFIERLGMISIGDKSIVVYTLEGDMMSFNYEQRPFFQS